MSIKKALKKIDKKSLDWLKQVEKNTKKVKI